MSIAEREFSKLFSIDNSSSKQLTIKEAVKAALVKIETLHAKKGAAGLSTGLPDLDRMTCGLHNADMIVIGARPSTGKTSLGWGIAEHVAIEHNLPVGVFSLEMSTESLVMRALCSLGKVDSQHVRTGDLIESDFTKLAAAASKLAKAPIYIDDTAGLNLSAMRSKALRWHQLYGIKLLVIDYLQLLQVLSQRRGDNRQQEVAMISNGVKALAKELDIPIIVLAQLNRDMDKTAGKKSGPRKPRMSDLRESGAIEQDADLIGLLWKTETEDEEEEHSASDVVPVRLTIAKQRNGPTGDIDLAFLRSYTRFESAAKGGPIE
jgi:replicative DNA helicase